MRSIFLFLFFFISIGSYGQSSKKIGNNVKKVTDLLEGEFPSILEKTAAGKTIKTPLTLDKARKLVFERINVVTETLTERKLVKIRMRFVVDKQGNVSAAPIEAAHPSFIIEGKRVVQEAFPECNPGMRKERPIAVLYDFPVIITAVPAVLDPKVAAKEKELVERLLKEGRDKAARNKKQQMKAKP